MPACVNTPYSNSRKLVRLSSHNSGSNTGRLATASMVSLYTYRPSSSNQRDGGEVRFHFHRSQLDKVHTCGAKGAGQLHRHVQHNHRL